MTLKDLKTNESFHDFEFEVTEEEKKSLIDYALEHIKTDDKELINYAVTRILKEYIDKQNVEILDSVVNLSENFKK